MEEGGSVALGQSPGCVILLFLCYQSGKKLENGSLRSTPSTHLVSLKP